MCAAGNRRHDERQRAGAFHYLSGVLRLHEQRDGRRLDLRELGVASGWYLLVPALTGRLDDDVAVESCARRSITCASPARAAQFGQTRVLWPHEGAVGTGGQVGARGIERRSGLVLGLVEWSAAGGDDGPPEPSGHGGNRFALRT